MVFTSNVDVVADKRVFDTSEPLSAGRSEVFFSIRTVLVDERFFGLGADGAATSVPASVDPA